MRERSTVEVQYSKALQAIAKKAEKLVQQHMAAAVMGDNPSKGVTEDVVSRRYVPFSPLVSVEMLRWY